MLLRRCNLLKSLAWLIVLGIVGWGVGEDLRGVASLQAQTSKRSSDTTPRLAVQKRAPSAEPSQKATGHRVLQVAVQGKATSLPTAQDKQSLPVLYNTGLLVLKHIAAQEARRDATCWTTVRMMEHFYARKELSKHASLLKIQATRLLIYQVWRHASHATAAPVLGKKQMEAAIPAVLRRDLSILRRPEGYLPPQRFSKLKHYHQTTENWRMILSIVMESLVGEGLFVKGVVHLKPLTYAGAQRLANVSTSLTILLLQEAYQVATRRHHHIIRFADLQAGYKAVSALLKKHGVGAKQGPRRVAFPIQNRALGLRLARRLAMRNMRQKIRSLRAWNRRVWKGKNSREQLRLLLNRLSPKPLTLTATNYIFQLFQHGLKPMVHGESYNISNTLITPSGNFLHSHPEQIKKMKKQPYLSLQWISQRLEDLFGHQTLVNGDVKLRYGLMDTNAKIKIKRDEMTGPALDAIRDTTIHWAVMLHVWSKFPRGKAIDPFAAEVLAERISEFVQFFLQEANRQLKSPKTTHFTKAHFEKVAHITTNYKFLPPSPAYLRWGDVIRREKKKLLAQYQLPLFENISAKSGIRQTSCDSMRASLLKGKYAFLQMYEFSYIPPGRLDLIDRRPTAKKLRASSKPDNIYPGIQTFVGSGIAVGDYDQDGRPDIFIGGEGCNRLYRNLGNYRFQDVTDKVGLDDKRYDTRQALFVDVNQDGRLDLFVVHGTYPSRLWIQTPDGRFVDRTRESGIKTTVGANTATFFDYDNDGKLDLYIGYFGAKLLKDRQMPSIDGRNARKNRMYRNLGNGRFEEVTDRAGTGSTGWTLAAAALDFNQDGKLDLFLSNDFGHDELYLNQGDGTFKEVARRWGLDDRANGMNASYTDYNHDGRWDLYVSVIDMFSKKLRFILPTPKDIVKLDEQILRSSFYLSGNKFYVSDARQTDFYKSLEHQHFEPGLRGWAWSGNFFDYENDGDEDFYLANGWTTNSYAANQANQFFVRHGKRYFLHPNTVVAHRGHSRSVVAVDLSGTGKIDLIVNDFKAAPRIYKNVNRFGHSWLKVRLRGVKNNYHGVGASIRVAVQGLPTQMRQVSVGSNYMSQDPTTVTFGLKNARQAEKIWVHWPGGKIQVVQGPFPANRTITIREEASAKSR